MTRKRSIGYLSNSYYRTLDFNPPLSGGGQTSDTTVTSTKKYAGTLKVITDVSTPNFKKLKSVGTVVMSPMTLTFDKRETSIDDFVLGPNPQWGSRRYMGPLACIWSNPVIRPGWFGTRITDAKSRTLLVAHSKVAKSDVQGMVTVVEARKTASMIARPLAGSRQVLDNLVGRKLKLVKSGLTVLEASKRAWLEYRFGWKPLLFELEGIQKAYIARYEDHLKPVRLVARSSDKDISWEGNDSTSGPAPALSGALMRRDYLHNAKVSSGVLYELTDADEAAATRRRLGLRLSDIPSSLWELVPYSFVVDRFVDFGLWLDAITPKPGVKVLGSWTTVVDRAFNQHELLNCWVDVGSPLIRYQTKGGIYRETIHSVTRTANPPLPLVPTINYRELSLVQHIDHLALLIADFRKLRH